MGARVGASADRSMRTSLAARSCVTGMPLRRGACFPRGWGEWGGPWLPAHYPVLVLKRNSTASPQYMLTVNLSCVAGRAAPANSAKGALGLSLRHVERLINRPFG
jgi:hypothetical protein